MPNTTDTLRLDRLGAFVDIPVSPGTAARVTQRLDVGAIDGGVVSLASVTKGSSGDQVRSLGSTITTDGGTVALTAADLAGVEVLRLQVTTASGTAGTITQLAVGQDIPDYGQLPQAGPFIS